MTVTGLLTFMWTTRRGVQFVFMPFPIGARLE